MVLAEKGLGWTSHHVDLDKGEHGRTRIWRINPNGVVPALVHDGAIIIESSDIMEYLDEQFPIRRCVRTRERELLQVRQWVARQDSIQRSLKVLSSEFVFARSGPRTAGRHRARRSPGRCTCRRSPCRGEPIHQRPHLDRRDVMSLADVAWAVDVHRFAMMRFPMVNTEPCVPGIAACDLTSFRQACCRTKRPSFAAGWASTRSPMGPRCTWRGHGGTRAAR
jgi:hypothetical protein